MTLGMAAVSCVNVDPPSADAIRIKKFLIEQNILRSSDEQTILAMLDWSRRNLVHDFARDPPIPAVSKTAVELIEQGERDGHIIVGGCWGTAAFFAETLGAVGIEAIEETALLSGKTHARVDFPLLQKTAIHADDLHRWTVSFPSAIPSAGLRREVPAEDILAPTSYISDFGGAMNGWRAHEAEIIGKYLPNISILSRTKLYGHFYTDDEIRQDLTGERLINNLVIDREVLELLDAEIARLGGPDQAWDTIYPMLDYPYRHTKLVPAL